MEASLQEELDLLHKLNNHSPSNSGRKNLFHHWKLKLLESMKFRRSHCVICIQVQQITNLPSAVEGRALIVGWKTKGSKGEHTNPVYVDHRKANFDEIFLHYCGTEKSQSQLRSFMIWVSLVDSADCELGRFHVDLSELANNDQMSSNGNICSNSRFGGRGMRFTLGGMADGGILNLSVYCRMMDKDSQDVGDGRKNESKGRSLSYMSDFCCLRTPSVLTKRIPSLRSERDRGGFITIENSNSIHDDSIRLEEDEDGGFITIEKGTISASSRSVRPPSDNLANTTDDDEDISGHEDEKACLMAELHEDFDVEKVEDEFLTMLEDKYWKKGREVKVEPWRKGIEESLNLSIDLNLDLDLDLNLDSLIKEAEIELAKAAQAWKSRVGAAVVEKEEYEDLVKRWGSRENCSKGYNQGFGFGSPI
ncbi:hypothetical protein LUZ60_006877 [Juncus effusus]|nr:hypothetical protein LUZ60_006877 [Juncus effusus]